MISLRIGNFEIGPSYAGNPDSIQIMRAGDDPAAGEAGDFPIKQFEEAIRAFYEEHF